MHLIPPCFKPFHCPLKCISCLSIGRGVFFSLFFHVYREHILAEDDHILYLQQPTYCQTWTWKQTSQDYIFEKEESVWNIDTYNHELCLKMLVSVCWSSLNPFNAHTVVLKKKKKGPRQQKTETSILPLKLPFGRNRAFLVAATWAPFCLKWIFLQLFFPCESEDFHCVSWTHQQTMWQQFWLHSFTPEQSSLLFKILYKILS